MTNKKRIRIIVSVIIAVALTGVIWLGQYLLERIIYPTKYSEIIESNAEKYNIDSAIIYSIIRQESGYKAESISNKGAIGLMQIMPKTANYVIEKYGLDYSIDNLSEPNCNIELGVAYYAYLLKVFDNDEILALLAYNGGEGRVREFIKNGYTDYEDFEYSESVDYVHKVQKNKKRYTYILKKKRMLN